MLAQFRHQHFLLFLIAHFQKATLPIMAVFIPTIALTMYTMVKSKRLSDFLDAVSDERLPAWAKLKAFIGVWRREPG